MWMALGRHGKQGKEEEGGGMGHERGEEKGGARGQKEQVKMREGIMKREKEQGWKGAWEGGRAPPSHPQTGVHKYPPVWQGILPFPAPTARSQHGGGQREGCSVPPVPSPCPCRVPPVPTWGWTVSPEGHGPPSAPLSHPGVAWTRPQPGPFPSPVQ